MGSEDFEDATREFDRVRDKARVAVMNGDGDGDEAAIEPITRST